MTPIWIASDHAGYDTKENLIKSFSDWSWNDQGPSSTSSVDYPDFADRVAAYINQNPHEKAVLICGSGQGMCIRANKYPQVRAALCYNEDITRLSRQHNDANILCLGARGMSLDLAQRIVKIFFETPFEGGRHAARVDKLSLPIKK
ncbi:MAG: ribose 5-phosphate isomerase B [Bdellovibrionales bacterium]